jgi:carboxymethylenebutenolidase
MCVDLFSHGDDGHSLRDAVTMKDLSLGLALLTEEVSPGPVGVIGFCLGGRLALLLATHYPQIAACADFYGRPINSTEEPDRHPEHPMDRLHLLRCPVIAHFGADDPTIPIEQAEQLDSKLTQLGIQHRVVVHAGAGHAFLNHTDAHSYRPEVARAAWADTVRFFAETLHGSASLAR